MPPLTGAAWMWAAAIAIAAVFWFIVVSPYLLPRLAKRLHHKDGDAEETLTIVDKLILHMSSITMFLTAVIVCIMFFEVVMRYFFERPTLWVEELSRWLGGIVFLMAGLYSMQQRSHIRVVILYDVVPRAVQRLFDLIGTACIVIFSAAVLWGYWTNAWGKLITWELYGSAWNPPIPAIMKPLICVTVLLLAIQAVNNLVVDWKKPKAAPHDPADDL